jgi:hypothetical protein
VAVTQRRFLEKTLSPKGAKSIAGGNAPGARGLFRIRRRLQGVAVTQRRFLEKALVPEDI